MIKEGDLILFQGDSITDSHRKRRWDDHLGDGYVQLINQKIQVHYSDGGIRCLNRGVYGNRTKQLKQRWKKDCLELKPDCLSILAGINDTWRRYDWGLVTTEKQFMDHYRYLLDEAYQMNPELKVVLISPFMLPVEKGQVQWYEDLNPKIAIVEELAKEYGTKYIPMQHIFNQVTTALRPPKFWLHDGVHPTAAGNCLLATKWIETCFSIKGTNCD